MAVRKMKVDFRPNLSKLQANNKKRIVQLKQLDRPHKEISIMLLRWVLKNFASEGRLAGGWKPFKLGGRKIGGFIDTSAKLLQHTGKLRASYAPFSNRRTAGVGSDLFYSKFQNDGTNRLPARRMLPDEDDVEEDIVKIYEQHVVKKGKVTGER